jgi:hypothetical protein
VNLSGHVVVWVSALVLAASAPALVRAYAGYLERRTRARADALLATFLGPEAKILRPAKDVAVGSLEEVRADVAATRIRVRDT